MKAEKEQKAEKQPGKKSKFNQETARVEYFKGEILGEFKED